MLCDNVVSRASIRNRAASSNASTLEWTYSAGVLAISTRTPGNCWEKLWANATEVASRASHTTNRAAPWLSTSLREKRLYAISDPIRPRPMKLMLLFLCAPFAAIWRSRSVGRIVKNRPVPSQGRWKLSKRQSKDSCQACACNGSGSNSSCRA